jgi:leucyl aminopeptidase
MPVPAFSAVDVLALSVAPHLADVDLLFVPIFQGEETLGDLPGVDDAVGGEWRRALQSREFAHRTYETSTARVTGAGWLARRLCFVGAGPLHEADPERLRRVAAVCGSVGRQRAAASIAILVRADIDVAIAAQAFADGLVVASFDSGTYKSDRNNLNAYPASCAVLAPGADATSLQRWVARGQTIGEGANVARELANEPGNVLTPAVFADRVSGAAATAGVAVNVLDEKKVRDLGMRLLLAVAQGSAEPPRLIVLRHEPGDAPASPVIAFVGKGVTFDSGGISIKPADGMDRMKDDMSGGAAVAAAICALARLKAPFRVIGVIPSVENMPGGRAMRPGDVVVGANGKSVEIINTDAEGRLILADALWYAEQQGATHIVDVATLTGAMVVALGRHVSGLFGESEEWVETVRAAAGRAGDRVWPLPIYEEAKEQLKSEIADMVNSAGRPGGAVTAAAFLREFVSVAEWAHLDIAGTAWSEARKAYQPKGATGVAVRTLVEIGLSGGKRPA